MALVPWELGHDGRSLFGSIYTRGWAGVIRVDAPTGQVKRIRRFGHPAVDQADGSFDGRWLVWNEYHSLRDFNDFTTWAWDSRSGQLKNIGAASRGSDNSFWQSPWREPDARAGIATWVQGSGPEGIGDLHVYDLAHGRDLVVRTGHLDGPFLLDGPIVVWPEWPGPTAATQMHAFDPVAGRDVTPPPALQPLRGVAGLSSDGSALAYPDARYKALWIAPSLNATPRLVVPAHGVNHIDNSVEIGGRYVGFGIQPRTFLGDTKLGRYLQISHGGWTRVDNHSLVLVHATASKERYATTDIAFIPLRKLPRMPACRS